MARRMIRVRSKLSGEVAAVSDRALGYFAGHYELVGDEPPEAVFVEPGLEPADSPSPKTSVRRAAASSDKE